MINRQRIWALMRKDWRELARNKQAVVPLVIIPLLFSVIIPTSIIVLGNNAVLESSITGLQGFLEHRPDGVIPAGFSTAQTVVYAVIVYFMAPFFLVIPVMVASITASSSFVGEKERRTIGGLLYTPITDRELVLAKVLVSVIPSVLLTWVSFLLCTVPVNALGAPLLGGLFFPTWTWAVIVLAMVPLVVFLAPCLIVGISRAFHDDARRSGFGGADRSPGHCPRCRSGESVRRAGCYCSIFPSRSWRQQYSLWSMSRCSWWSSVASSGNASSRALGWRDGLRQNCQRGLSGACLSG